MQPTTGKGSHFVRQSRTALDVLSKMNCFTTLQGAYMNDISL